MWYIAFNKMMTGCSGMGICNELFKICKAIIATTVLILIQSWGIFEWLHYIFYSLTMTKLWSILKGLWLLVDWWKKHNKPPDISQIASQSPLTFSLSNYAKMRLSAHTFCSVFALKNTWSGPLQQPNTELIYRLLRSDLQTKFKHFLPEMHLLFFFLLQITERPLFLSACIFCICLCFNTTMLHILRSGKSVLYWILYSFCIIMFIFFVFLILESIN